LADRLSPAAVSERRELTIVDIRSFEEREVMGWIPGSLHVNGDELLRVADEDAPVVLACASGRRSAALAERIGSGGLRVYDLEGGLLAWQKTLPVCQFPDEPCDPVSRRDFLRQLRSCFVVESVESGAIERDGVDPVSTVEAIIGDLPDDADLPTLFASIDRLALEAWRHGHRLDFIAANVSRFYGLARCVDSAVR
jgi:rhodanese-related sulfurtransferase